MSTINLAPTTQYVNAARARRQYLFVLSALVVIVLVIGWGILFGLTAAAGRQLQQVQNQVNALQVEIASVQADIVRIDSFEGRLAALDVLLDERVSVVPILLELERLLPAPTVLSRMLLQMEERTLHVAGSTTVLDEIAQTIASLDRPPSSTTTPFQHVTIAHIKRQEPTADAAAPSRYEFELKIDLASAVATPAL